MLALALSLALAAPPPTPPAPPPPSIVVAPIGAKDVVAGDGRKGDDLALELDALRPLFSACANEAGKEQTLVVTLTIRDDGTLASIDGPADQPKLTSCLRGTLASSLFSWSGAKSQTVKLTLHAVHGELKQGTISRAAMNDAVKPHMADVQKCYATDKAATEGDVTLVWLVDEDGTVRHVTAVGAPPGVRSVGACIRDKAAAWKLPKPAGGRAVVKYPFRFSRPAKPAAQ